MPAEDRAMLIIGSEAMASPARLTPAVLQAASMLGLYHAELARILGLLCGEVGQLASARKRLEPDSPAWQQAVSFLRFYRAIYQLHEGDRIASWHWLRVHNTDLQGVPLLLLVDDEQLPRVLAHVEALLSDNTNTGEGRSER